MPTPVPHDKLADDMARALREKYATDSMRRRFGENHANRHQPAAADVTARAYLDLTNLQWLSSQIQMVGDYIEQQGKIAAAQASGANVVTLRA